MNPIAINRVLHLKRNKRGFTLVELLVAALIVLISIYTVIFIIQKSEQQSVNNNHRESARKALISLLESEMWNQDHYNNLLLNDTTSISIVIDNRQTEAISTDDLHGTIVFRNVFIDSTSAKNISLNKIPYIIVRGVVKWQELEGNYDSIAVEKIICKLN